MVHLKLIKNEIEAEKSASVPAWIISVKLRTGCYRHIQIPKKDTLAVLADVILWSFDFVNDHAHAFFMDNVAWSDADSYFLSFVSDDGEERYTENVYLDIVLVAFRFHVRYMLLHLPPRFLSELDIRNAIHHRSQK